MKNQKRKKLSESAEKLFFLKSRSTGDRETEYVYQLPAAPKKMIEQLGWADNEPLKMKIYQKGDKIPPGKAIVIIKA